MPRPKNNTGANLGFEDNLWAAADRLRGNMSATIRRNLEALAYGG